MCTVWNAAHSSGRWGMDLGESRLAFTTVRDCLVNGPNYKYKQDCLKHLQQIRLPSPQPADDVKNGRVHRHVLRKPGVWQTRQQTVRYFLPNLSLACLLARPADCCQTFCILLRRLCAMCADKRSNHAWKLCASCSDDLGTPNRRAQSITDTS